MQMKMVFILVDMNFAIPLRWKIHMERLEWWVSKLFNNGLKSAKYKEKALQAMRQYVSKAVMR